MGYFNPIFQFGLKTFFLSAKKSGVDGVIIVDLPPEENDIIKDYTKKFNIHNIRLLTPTTKEDRLKTILRSTKGFLYYISIMGITGTKKPSLSLVKKAIKKIKRNTSLPIVVGFGINSKKQISEINKFADGAVVGSAIIKIIEKFIKKKPIQKELLIKNIKSFLQKIQNHDKFKL